MLPDLDHQLEADRLMEELRAEIRKLIAAEITKLAGAHRAYAWSIGDPTTTPPPAPPAPFVVELPCRPIDLVASCLTAPTGTASFDLQRSADGGATYATILTTPTTIAAGATFGAGGRFVTGAGSLPITLAPGDLIKLVPTESGAKSLSIQLRVQRVGEFAERGR